MMDLAKLYRTDSEKFYQTMYATIDKLIDHPIKVNGYIDKLANDIYEYDINNGKKGYIYCLYNEVYQHYGKDVYKLGMTKNIKKRLTGYTTAYLYDSEIKL